MSLLLFLLLAGCGSETSEAGLAGNGSNSQSATGLSDGSATGTTNQPYTGFILGRVKLQPGLQEGPVEVTDLTGNLLMTLQADKQGWFSRTSGTLPVEFRLRAVRGRYVFLSDFRGGWPGGTLYINGATTLASHYLKTHPGVSMADIESRIQTHLKLPPGFRLSWISSINTSRFNTAVFFENVRRLGLENYLDTLVQQIDTPVLASLLADAGWKLLDYCGSAVVGATVNDASGAVVANCGLNFTTAGALGQIEQAIQAVSEQISALSAEMTQFQAQEALRATLQPLNGHADNVQAAINNITIAASDFQNSHSVDGAQNTIQYNTPSDYPALASTTSQIQNLNLDQELAPIMNSLTDVSGTGLYRTFVLWQMGNIGQQNDTSFNGYPYRYNELTRQQMHLFASFVNTLTQGGELTMEYAHLQTNLVAALRAGNQKLDQIATAIQTANQQIPDLLPSDEFIMDPANGYMALNHFMAAKSYADAQTFATNAQIGPYAGWVIPSRTQLTALVERRAIPATLNPTISGSTWDNSPTSNWTNAFTRIGINTDNYAKAIADNKVDNREGAYYYPPDTNNNNSVYWWNGTASGLGASNPSTDSGGTINSSSFLLVKSLNDSDFKGARAQPSSDFYLALNDASTGNLTDNTNNPSTGTNSSAVNLSPWTLNSAFGRNNPPSTIVPGVGTVLNTTTGSQLQATDRFGLGPVYFGSYWGGGDGSSTTNNFDITGRVVWSSSNTTAATISNFASANSTRTTAPSTYPGPAGWLTWHPSILGDYTLPSSVQVTASFYTNTGTTGTFQKINNVFNVTLPNPAPTPHLTQVNITPVNQQYNVAANPTTVVNCTLTAYYADSQLQDVSTDANTTWTLTDDNGAVLNSSTVGGFGVAQGTQKNQLLLTPNITTTNVTISANYHGPWGTQTCSGKMALILPSASPTIGKILPATGSIAGGTRVTITGTNLSGTTSVTFGGVASSSVNVITSTQLNVLVPGRATAGSVPVVIFTNSGDTTGQTANFVYVTP